TTTHQKLRAGNNGLSPSQSSAGRPLGKIRKAISSRPKPSASQTAARDWLDPSRASARLKRSHSHNAAETARAMKRSNANGSGTSRTVPNTSNSASAVRIRGKSIEGEVLRPYRLALLRHHTGAPAVPYLKLASLDLALKG